MIRRAIAAKILASLGAATLAIAALGGPALAVTPPTFSNASSPAACPGAGTAVYAGDITAQVSDILSTNVSGGVAAVTLRINNCATSSGTVHTVAVVAPAGYTIAGPTGSNPGTDFSGLSIAPGASGDVAMSVTLPSGLADVSTATWQVFAEAANEEGNEGGESGSALNDDFAPYPASPTSIVAPTLSSVTVTNCAPGVTCTTSVGSGGVTSNIGAGGSTIAGPGAPAWASTCATLLASAHKGTFPNSGAIVYSSTSGAEKTITIVFPKAVVKTGHDSDADHYQVCFHYPTTFVTLKGTSLVGNATDGYTGLLPDCRNAEKEHGKTTPAVVPPCVVSKGKTKPGDVVIVYKVPAGVIDPGHMAG